MKIFTDRCVAGIEADEKRCAELIEGSLAMCASLAPKIGYDKAAAIAKEAYKSGKTVRYARPLVHDRTGIEALTEKG